MQCATGIENCAAGFLTHSRADAVPLQTDDLDAEWPSRPRRVGPLPNLVVTAANVLEVYIVRVQEDQPPKAADPRRGTLLDGIDGASLELVCHYRFRLCPLTSSRVWIVLRLAHFEEIIISDYFLEIIRFELSRVVVWICCGEQLTRFEFPRREMLIWSVCSLVLESALWLE